MGNNINWNRVILGGLLAGLIINLSEWLVNGVMLRTEWANVMTGLGKPTVATIKQIAALNLWGFAVGLVMVWLYAAIRPRYGAGPKTAICAGLAVWALAYLLGGAFPVIFHLFPKGLALIGLAIGIVEVLVGALAGAALYKEDAAAEPRLARAAGAR